MGYEPIEHTADLGLRVWGSTLAELFTEAAAGMCELMWDRARVRPERRRRLEVEADDLEGLLVGWLSEINFQHVTNEEVYARAVVQQLDVERCRLVGELAGEPIDPSRHRIHTEIKAVTYHDLAIERTDDGYEARIVFDV
ncbi:MAG: archease [Planctomycetota bacterium]|nr:MAG: archease [Planctomycetota bacterium]